MLPQFGPMTRALLIANVVVFMVQSLLPGALEQRFALWPIDSGLFGFWQVVTYAFLHGGIAHLLFNMFGLVIFGSDLERVFGPQRYLQLYGASVVFAAATQLFINAAMGEGAPTVGASGGVYGLVLGFAMLFPERRIMLLFPPIPMPARVFAFLFAGLELFLGVTRTQSGVAHFAHLGGMIGAFLLIRHWRAARRN